MNIDELIARINELHKKSKEEGLTEEEKEEQQKLRREYIDGFKNSLRQQLNGIEPKNKEN
ncbi:DUF896 domain-containing protein [Clostridium tarantellae]|uniref:UPF0291 protein GBZ86_05815 n=1 Tax=Clostridium tarantellae TaxID=39493 RepID=A0A6I1MSR1_9CLOT|nr:DUF896 domain-containing protein [Clostridium tarantellae]MPQ43279.1 DUF896 domain-containing protein [Clostridium tarantellae]